MAEGIEAFFETEEEDETVILGEEESPEEVIEEEEEVKEETEVIAESGDGDASPEPAEAEPTEEPKEVAGDGQNQEVISSLRQMLREQAREIKELKGQSGQLTQTLAESGVIDESDLKPSQDESGSISEERMGSLSLLAETMAVSGQFPQFAEVCSQANFDMTIEALARQAVQEDGGTLTEQVENVSAYVWGLGNPYKFVYDILKENHPKYKEPEKEVVEKEKVTPKAPGSVGKVAGGSGSKNEGWTSSKIDALEEEDLHKVPQAVYEKYMQNELN